MLAGAADSALATGSFEAAALLLAAAVSDGVASLLAAVGALLHAPIDSTAVPAQSRTHNLDNVIDPSFRSEGRAA
jgi:hypothetical protein